MKQRQIVTVSLAIAVIVLAFVGVIAVAANTTTATDQKQQARQYQATWQAQHGASPAPKATGSPPAQSCPINVSNITPTVNTQPPTIGQKPYTSTIYTVSTEKKPYFIGGGTNQIVVQEQIIDICAIPYTPFPFLTYPAPGSPGSIHLTAVSGDVVTFTTDAGTTGHFNYVTGQYL